MKFEKIAIAANFTIEPIAEPLKAVLARFGCEPEIEFAPYNQIFQQMLDPGSLFYGNGDGHNIIFLRLEDLVDTKQTDYRIGDSELAKIRQNAADLAQTLQNAERFKSPLFVFICPPSMSLQSNAQISAALKEIEAEFTEAVANTPNCYLFSTGEINARYRVVDQDNPLGNKLGHVPYSPEFFTALAVETVRKINVIRRSPFKVLVLDCDNTLWDGVVGEAGVEGIGFGTNRLFLQNFAAQQSAAGTVVCLCSKNNEPDVWEVFERRTEMPLKKDHVAAWKINWLPKSENLKALAAELQLGLDSFIFVDDDAAVCSEVEMNCPEVLTVLLPPESRDFREFFAHLWVFDKLKITDEDRARTGSYQKMAQRSQLQTQAANIEDFLKSLQLVCRIETVAEDEIPRVSQLSLRTNQFNSTTVRRSESDIRRLIAEPHKSVWTVKVSDRFGDYGLVGVVVFEETADALDVDSFMLSCRVLGRGVEYKILKELGRKASESNLQSINIEFQSSAKNAPFAAFLREVVESAELKAANEIPVADALAASERLKCKKSDAATKIVKAKTPAKAEAKFDAAVYQTYLELADALSQGKSLLATTEKAEIARDDQKTYLAPQTDTEKKLTEIWESLLNLKNISVRDSFFEIGGDSLLAVTLFVEIEEAFGKSLPLSALLGAPTVEKLAREVEADSSINDWKYLVPIQTEGTRAPLFCMHAAGGNVLFYRDLANELGADQPVYGLQSRGIADKSETAHDRVEEMAREYLIEIRQLQPHGPYHLCGSSFGGLVAFEAARQLQGAGEKVEILALFDTYAPGYLRANENQPSGVFKGLSARFANIKNQLSEISSTRARAEFVLNRFDKVRIRFKRKIAWKKNQFAIQYNQATGKELPPDVQRNHKAIQKALDTYQPLFYHGDMILFRASDQPKDIKFDSFLGWRSFVRGKISTRDVKGTHGALTVYPFASDLAQKFEPFLHKTRKAASVAAVSA